MLHHQLIISFFFLFFLGCWGLLFNNNNLLKMLMSIEIILLSINIIFVLFSLILNDIIGQLFMIFILTVAAGETAIGLGIIMNFFRLNKNIQISSARKVRF